MPSVRSAILRAACVGFLHPIAASAQGEPYQRGLDLEQRERYADAAVAYREAIASAPGSLAAVLGLERVYAQLGWTDSILPVLARAIAAAPRAAPLRTALLRSLRSLGRYEESQRAFEQWRRDWPGDATPYRELTRLLIAEGRTAAGDSLLHRARAELGTERGMELELAQLRAATGQWELSAAAWRDAVTQTPHYDQAAVFSLMPMPPAARDGVRRVLARPPVTPGARRVLAALEVAWGSPREGWAALAQLRPASDTLVLQSWLDFAKRAEESEAWLVARDALAAAYTQTQSPEHAVRAATNALNGGDAQGAARLAARAESALDSATAARTAVPVRLRALSTLGRADEAQQLLAAYDRLLHPAQRGELTQLLAWGWVRSGNTAKARDVLGDTSRVGAGGEARGWLALYDGDLSTARRFLKPTRNPSPELLAALAFIGRTTVDSAPTVGRAFLALARGDTVAAAAAFEEGAREIRDVSTLLMAHAARLHATRQNDVRALELWQRIAESRGDSPEAPEANLEWARMLRRTGQTGAAIERLEYLILTYPQSALVPQARRELELARQAVPPAS
jgi:tetratricopeptide (TPR) repeat protein